MAAVRRLTLSFVKTALTYVAIFSVGTVTTVACFEPDFENPSFRCNPSANGGLCPESEVCCSDDPATIGGRVPNYYEPTRLDDIYDVPIFSGANNTLSSSGMCIDVAGLPAMPFVNRCPVPCNPTWSAAEHNRVCGEMSFCCQTQELDPVLDCVNVEGKWRAVTGADIGVQSDGKVITNWGDLHTTNQDPFGENCTLFSSGNNDVKEDCFDQLSVANQRGFCKESCPCVEDVCDMKNPGYIPKCGGVAPVI